MVETQDELVRDTDIRRQVLRRHRDAIVALRAHGFEGPAVYDERSFPLSYLLLWPVTALMRSKGAVVRSTRFLCLTTAYPLLGHRETQTFALVSALGVKFLTGFTDGTLLLTTNTVRTEHLDAGAHYYKYVGGESVEALWAFHRGKIEVFLDDGKTLQTGLAFADYLRLSRIETLMESPVLLTRYLSLPFVRILLAFSLFIALTLCSRLWLLPWLAAVLKTFIGRM
jgi:hypothetical protein